MPLVALRTLPHLAVLAQINTLVLLEVRCQPVNNALVKVIATQMGVTRGGQHLKDTVANLQGICTDASRTIDVGRRTGKMQLPGEALSSL